MTAEALAKVAVDRPLPVPDAATGPYWEAARDRAAGHAALRRLRPLPFLSAHACARNAARPISNGRGERRRRVYSFTVIHRAPSPAFAAAVPYVVAAVKLAEGPHLMSNIVGIAPDDVRIGMPVKVVFQKFSDESLCRCSDLAEKHETSMALFSCSACSSRRPPALRIIR